MTSLKTSIPPSIPKLPAQNHAQEHAQTFPAYTQQSLTRRFGRFCEKILIVCCLTFFVALLVAAVFNASAVERRLSPSSDARFSSHDQVKTLLLQAIRKQAWSDRYETGRLRLTLPSEFPQKGRLRVRSMLWDEASRRFSATVDVSSTHPFTKNLARTRDTLSGEQKSSQQRFSLNGEAIPYVRVLAARRALLYGTRITRADLKMVELPINSRKLRSALTDISQVLGMEIRFRRKAGDVLRARDLRPARLVQRRSTVQVAYDVEGVRVVLQALALNDAAHGETVRLRNRYSGREFSAVVDGLGHASVHTSAMSDAMSGEGEELAPSMQRAKNQRDFADNPFRDGRQGRYDNLLNEPLSGRAE